MPLTPEEIAELDPSDPADAAILQEEALHYVEEAGELAADNEALVVQVEEVSEDYNSARREAANLRIQQQAARPSRAIKLARRS